MDWTLRYTLHLGYAPPDFRAQFLATVGTGDAVDHVAHAARFGMAGVLYPWAVERPPGEVTAVGAALTANGLSCSCVVATPISTLQTDIWVRPDAGNRRRLEGYIVDSARAANALGSTVLAALVTAPTTASDPRRAWTAATDNLNAAAKIAADHGLSIAVEPMKGLPGILLQSTGSAIDFVRQVDHPAAGIIYDTGHVAHMGEDLLVSLADAYPHLRLVQLADNPGRVEPGAGGLDLVSVGVELIARGYDGLVDFEHGWLDESQLGEKQGFERLVAFDSRVASAAGNP